MTRYENIPTSLETGIKAAMDAAHAAMMEVVDPGGCHYAEVEIDGITYWADYRAAYCGGEMEVGVRNGNLERAWMDIGYGFVEDV